MEKMVGDKIQEWLGRLTATRFKVALFGTGVTAVSLMMATMVGLVSSYLITLEQAVGTMMGDEIGTTITTQIAATDTDNLERTHLALVKRRFGHFAAANDESGSCHVS